MTEKMIGIRNGRPNGDPSRVDSGDKELQFPQRRSRPESPLRFGFDGRSEWRAGVPGRFRPQRRSNHRVRETSRSRVLLERRCFPGDNAGFHAKSVTQPVGGSTKSAITLTRFSSTPSAEIFVNPAGSTSLTLARNGTVAAPCLERTSAPGLIFTASVVSTSATISICAGSPSTTTGAPDGSLARSFPRFATFVLAPALEGRSLCVAVPPFSMPISPARATFTSAAAASALNCAACSSGRR